jgi:hypothetical protein
MGLLDKIIFGVNFFQKFNSEIRETYLDIKEFIARRELEKNVVLRIASNGVYGGGNKFNLI